VQSLAKKLKAKNLKMKKLIMIILSVMLIKGAIAQTFSEVIKKEIAFEKVGIENTVLVSNINGNIHVQGYDGTKVLLEVTKKITAKNESRLEQGKKEIQLGVIDRADTLIFYMVGGCNTFGKINNKRARNFGSRHQWGYNWDGNHDCNPPYDYKLDFILKVPYSINVVLGTVNEGDISVENVNGVLKVDNINGAIKLKNISREATASTINGNVDIEYSKNPDKACRFYTLNGDINAWFQKGLTANMAFKSFNGEFYTNVKSLESLPVEVEKESGEKEIKYKLNGNRFKIGNGGALLDFETFNGNVYLKEITN
jgi:DUF4097 and DUF4098 domain-containing protein YvlB